MVCWSMRSKLFNHLWNLETVTIATHLRESHDTACLQEFFIQGDRVNLVALWKQYLQLIIIHRHIHRFVLRSEHFLGVFGILDSIFYSDAALVAIGVSGRQVGDLYFESLDLYDDSKGHRWSVLHIPEVLEPKFHNLISWKQFVQFDTSDPFLLLTWRIDSYYLGIFDQKWGILNHLLLPGKVGNVYDANILYFLFMEVLLQMFDKLQVEQDSSVVQFLFHWTFMEPDYDEPAINFSHDWSSTVSGLGRNLMFNLTKLQISGNDPGLKGLVWNVQAHQLNWIMVAFSIGVSLFPFWTRVAKNPNFVCIVMNNFIVFKVISDVYAKWLGNICF